MFQIFTVQKIEKQFFCNSHFTYISTLKSHTFWANDGFIFIEKITRPFSRENIFFAFREEGWNCVFMH